MGAQLTATDEELQRLAHHRMVVRQCARRYRARRRNGARCLRIEISNAEQTLDAFVKIGVLAEEQRNDAQAIEAAISLLCKRGYTAIKAERMEILSPPKAAQRQRTSSWELNRRQSQEHQEAAAWDGGLARPPRSHKGLRIRNRPATARSRRSRAACPDSLGKLIVDFYGDRMFTDLKPSTRQLYRYALEPIAKEHGHRSATLMTSENGEKIINRIGEKRPGMGNLTRAVLRRVMQFAIKQKRRKDNPMLGIEGFKVGEHHTWTDAELKQFESKWRLGTRQRLAYALLLYTGQRCRRCRPN